MSSLPPENVQRTHASHSRSAHKFPICIVAPDIDVPLNIGSLFRVADALGVEKLYLAGSSAVPPHPRIRKTSRAAEQAVAYEYHAEPLALLLQLRAAGYLIASLELTTHSRDIRQVSSLRYEKIALIVGSENTGVEQALLDASDLTLHIPMFGQNSSMNLATACAIGVFELARRFMPDVSTAT
jgi:tRNA G18 (ribose-2'-O)-methylase SpoU